MRIATELEHARAIVKYVCDTLETDREKIAETVAKMNASRDCQGSPGTYQNARVDLRKYKELKLGELVCWDDPKTYTVAPFDPSKPPAGIMLITVRRSDQYKRSKARDSMGMPLAGLPIKKYPFRYFFIKVAP